MAGQETEVVDDKITEEVDTTPPEITAEAESQGWVPKEKFKRDPSEWVDAATFVKRGHEIMPILRKNNENLLKDLDRTKKQLEDFRATAEEFKKFQKESYEQKIKALETQVTTLRSSRAQAISDGDGTKVDALDEALDNAKEELKEAKTNAELVVADPPEPPKQEIAPELQQWFSENTWFGRDRRLTSVANAIGETLRLEQPSLKGKPFLDELDKILQEEFPEKFGDSGTTHKPARKSSVESGSNRPPRNTGGSAKSYDNLPSDAKAACDRFVRQKLMTKEEYVASYDWS